MCRSEKVVRLIQLFQTELEHGQAEVRSLRSQLATSCPRGHRVEAVHKPLDPDGTALLGDDADSACPQSVGTGWRGSCKRTCGRRKGRLAEAGPPRGCLGARGRQCHASAALGRLRAELERSRSAERRALARVEELQTCVALLREFGNDDFMRRPRVSSSAPRGLMLPLAADGLRRQADLDASAPAPGQGFSSPPQFCPPATPMQSASDGGGSTAVGTPLCLLGDASPSASSSPKLPSLLIAVELDLGRTSATLSVALWQSCSDYPGIVAAFLQAHGVRPVFVGTLVRYLEEVEATAEILPVRLKANLADLHGRYG